MEEQGSNARAIALFGMSDGVAWVADDAFVSRQGDDIVVEKWVGRRAVSIVVRRATCIGSMASLWTRLSEGCAGHILPQPCPQPADKGPNP